MALKDKLMTLEDFKAVRDVDVASNSAQFTELKAALDDLDEKIDNVSDTLSPEIKEALLNCFNHVAWSGDNGRSYYNALESALSGDNPPQPIYNWDFTQSLMDSKSGKIAELTASTGVSNPTRDSQGVHFTAAGQALLLFDENKNLADFANKTIQVDVASFVPDSANNDFHVRFLMYNRPTIGWDSGMVFRQAPSPNLGWSIYGNGRWGSASAWGSLTNRTDISGHTVSLYLDENLVPKLYIDSVLKGTQTLGFNTTGVGLMIGNTNPNPAAQGGTFYQSVVTGCRIYNGEVA